ncbi:unnamed protein product, partial [Discosporangium mesarthrocarpum]
MGEGGIKGGDVVRLCHLSSPGFLTYETVPQKSPETGFQGGRLWPWQGQGPGPGPGRGGGRGRKSLMRSQSWAGGTGGMAYPPPVGTDLPEAPEPFVYRSGDPVRRRRLQNASSNCLWVIERTSCELGGRLLVRGSLSSNNNWWWAEGNNDGDTQPDLSSEP